MVRYVLFVIAAVCIAFASSAEQDEHIEKGKKLIQKCLKESRTTADNVRQFTNGETFPDGMKCMLKCFMQGNKGMKEDGTIDVETIVKFSGAARRTSIETCKAAATSTDLCERALQYESCFLGKEPEFYKSTVNKLLA